MVGSLNPERRRGAWEPPRRVQRSVRMGRCLRWFIGQLVIGSALVGCAVGPVTSVAARPTAAPRARAESVVPTNGPNCVPRFATAPDLVALRAQHPESIHAAGTLPLSSPEVQRVLALWPDHRSFIAQATPRELATYGFIGEPAYSTGPGQVTGPSSPADPLDIAVFHGDWSADEVNMHGYGDGAHYRWVFVDARTGVSFGGGYGDCTTE